MWVTRIIPRVFLSPRRARPLFGLGVKGGGVSEQPALLAGALIRPVFNTNSSLPEGLRVSVISNSINSGFKFCFLTSYSSRQPTTKQGRKYVDR